MPEVAAVAVAAGDGSCVDNLSYYFHCQLHQFQRNHRHPWHWMMMQVAFVAEPSKLRWNVAPHCTDPACLQFLHLSRTN